MSVAEASFSTAEPAPSVTLAGGPCARSLMRWVLAPARLAHRDWWPGRLALALPGLDATCLPEPTVAPLSALLFERYRLSAEFDPGLLAPGPRQVVLLAPPYFDCVVSLLGVLAWRARLMQRVDAATYRSVLRAVPGVNLAEFFARIDADDALAGFQAPLLTERTPVPEEQWPSRLYQAGARLLLALAEHWGPAVRDRVVLRLPRRAAGSAAQTAALDVATRGKLEQQVLVCLAVLEDPQWL
jgi:hypothetical protein